MLSFGAKKNTRSALLRIFKTFNTVHFAPQISRAYLSLLTLTSYPLINESSFLYSILLFHCMNLNFKIFDISSALSFCNCLILALCDKWTFLYISSFPFLICTYVSQSSSIRFSKTSRTRKIGERGKCGWDISCGRKIYFHLK